MAQSCLRARAIITHFGISSLGFFRQILKSKNLEIDHYYCGRRGGGKKVINLLGQAVRSANKGIKSAVDS